MSMLLFILALSLIIGGVIVRMNPTRTWEIKKFLDQNAPSYMPEYWETVNYQIGMGMIALGLLFIFVIGFIR
jgi:hypothetical protein